ncbi:hypothetical protein [Sporosarcina sp. HYO08]|uniref:hypothetical protein n=1 Tax=Sporosarcina sp. HYO08 TaxID=1759557 RepID=UPI0007966A68|nr:hypothetical protein [Sporosarcina sp. HYO08]KXH86925.1 hypothetical protein AU377_13340 [Sporosarcina sp. HYO08]
MKNMKIIFEKIERKDYIYWICILLFLLILSWSVRINSTSELLDRISFGVGLSSLFLAVIAIFYSIVKGEQTSQQSTIAQQTLREIGGSINEINEIKKDIRKSVNEINQIKNEIKDTRSSMDSSFNNVFKMLYKFEDALANDTSNPDITSEVMDSLKTAAFSGDSKSNIVNEVYYDARFKSINKTFPDFTLSKMAETVAKQLGLRLVSFYTGNSGLIYVAFSGPDNIDFEEEFLKSDADFSRDLQLVKVEKVVVN